MLLRMINVVADIDVFDTYVIAVDANVTDAVPVCTAVATDVSRLGLRRAMPHRD